MLFQSPGTLGSYGVELSVSKIYEVMSILVILFRTSAC